MRFYIDIREAEVTKSYMELIYDAVRHAGGVLLPYSKKHSVGKEDFVITNEFPRTFLHMLRGEKNHILWIQGIIPEESYLRNRSLLRQTLLSAIEKYVLKKARSVLFVSEEMKLHYERKYKLSFSEKCVVFPCFSAENTQKSAFFEEKYKKNDFCYVGSLSAWQCFEKTVKLYQKVEKNAQKPTKFFVFTQEKAKAEEILKNEGVEHFEISYHEGEALGAALSKMKYGFVLRDDIAVNHVATPTKLSEYLACGVIPLFSSSLRDFARIHHEIPIGLCDPTAEDILRDMEKERTADEMKACCDAYFDCYYDIKTAEKRIADAVSGVYQKPKLLVTIGNLKMGGIGKALVAFLREMQKEYEIFLLAMREGECSAEIPAGVHRIKPTEWMRTTEYSLRELHGFSLGAKLFRFFGAGFSKLFGKRLPFRLLVKNFGTFDVAVAFSQPSGKKSFCNLTLESVLYGAKTAKKVTFLHADFRKYGGNDAYNRSLYRKFDGICPVSDAVGERFFSVMPMLRERTVTVPNFIPVEDILKRAEEEIAPLFGKIRILTVCRLEAEKGLFRCIAAMKKAKNAGIPFVWHLVGDGALRETLEKTLAEEGLSAHAVFHGNVENPYPFMKHADFLLLPSYHEAAPLVLEEARILGLPILTTKTLSAEALCGAFGVVSENEDEALSDVFLRFLSEKQYESIRKTYQKEDILREYAERTAKTKEILRDIFKKS